MANIILQDIVSGDVGSVWYNKINNNNDILETAVNSKSDIGHTHTKANITDFTHTHVVDDITDFDTQTYTGSQVIVAHQGVSKTVQNALDTIQGYIDGLVVSATVSNVYFLGSDSNSSIVTALLSLSATAFGLFTVKWIWDNSPTTSDFSSASTMTGMNSQVLIPKPSTGWDGSNQQYLHLNVVFTNASSTSGTALTVHNLVTKFSKDLTAEEISDIIINTPSFLQAVAGNLASSRSFRNAIATEVNSL